jgi:hypothetical protein
LLSRHIPSTGDLGNGSIVSLCSSEIKVQRFRYSRRFGLRLGQRPSRGSHHWNEYEVPPSL